MEEKGEKKIKRSKLGHHLPPPTELPWLVFSHGKRNKKQTIYSIADSSRTVCSIPELREKDIENSCHGWLILSSCSPTKKRFSLWNPVTSETRQLPPLKLDTESEITSCILTSPPSHPDSTLLIFDEGVYSIWFCNLQNRCWFKHCYREEIAKYEDERTKNCIHDNGNIRNYLVDPVSCKGKVYATSSQSANLLRIDVFEPDSIVLQSIIEMPVQRKKIPIFLTKNLLESNGDIFWIIIFWEPRVDKGQVMDIEIHKLDLLSMSWERVVRAKDRAFFVDGWRGSSICSEALGNRVYFLKLSDSGIYSYHLEDCNISASLPCPDLWPLQRPPVWVMADHRLSGFCREAMQISEKEHLDEEEPLTEIKTRDLKQVRKKRKNGEEGSKASGIQLINLPVDILKNICDCLNLHDYLSIGSVCKLGREAAPSLEWSSAFFRWETQSNSQTPWLMSARDNGRICKFAHPNSSNRYSVEVPEPLHDASIWYCKDGWLLIGKERGENNLDVSFYNPFTKDVIPYPELHVEYLGYSRIGFSSPPTSPTCVVIVLEEFSQLNYCHSREKIWHIISIEYDDFFSTLHNSPVFSSGAFYFLTEEGSLGFLKQQGEDWVWDIFVPPANLDRNYDESYLAEHDGDVFIVLTYEMGKQVRVLKLDPSTTSWKRVKNLGNYSLHVSRSSAVFTVAKTSEEQNKIYFPRFHEKRLVSYSLSTNSLQSSGFSEPLKNYDGTTEPTFCCWIKPSWS